MKNNSRFKITLPRLSSQFLIKNVPLGPLLKTSNFSASRREILP